MNKVSSLRQKKNMPEYGKKVLVHGTDTWGDWCQVAELKPYKSPPFKNAPPHRFVDINGNQIKHVEHWSEIEW